MSPLVRLMHGLEGLGKKCLRCNHVCKVWKIKEARVKQPKGAFRRQEGEGKEGVGSAHSSVSEIRE